MKQFCRPLSWYPDGSISLIAVRNANSEIATRLIVREGKQGICGDELLTAERDPDTGQIRRIDITNEETRRLVTSIIFSRDGKDIEHIDRSQPQRDMPVVDRIQEIVEALKFQIDI